jgi:hypothetical protein
MHLGASTVEARQEVGEHAKELVARPLRLCVRAIVGTRHRRSCTRVRIINARRTTSAKKRVQCA